MPHIALSVDDAADACERIRKNGGNVTREAGPVKIHRYHWFVEDPDGYKIELIESKDAGKGLELISGYTGALCAR